MARDAVRRLGARVTVGVSWHLRSDVARLSDIVRVDALARIRSTMSAVTMARVGALLLAAVMAGVIVYTCSTGE